VKSKKRYHDTKNFLLNAVGSTPLMLVFHASLLSGKYGIVSRKNGRQKKKIANFSTYNRNKRFNIPNCVGMMPDKKVSYTELCNKVRKRKGKNERRKERDEGRTVDLRRSIFQIQSVSIHTMHSNSSICSKRERLRKHIERKTRYGCLMKNNNNKEQQQQQQQQHSLTNSQSSHKNKQMS
jgi:hypothetical protein